MKKCKFFYKLIFKNPPYPNWLNSFIFRVVFSAFVSVLKTVEYFLNKITNRNAEALGLTKINSKWKLKEDYFLLEGSTTSKDRYEMIKKFNNKSDRKFRLFLISSKAGGIGVNLIGANRCVILGRYQNTEL